MTMISENENISRQSIPVESNRYDTVLPVLALFWPAAAGAVAFFFLHRRVARFVLGAVMVLIGYRLALVDERLDAYRLGEYVKETASQNYSGFASWVHQYCFNSEQCLDPVQPFYTFLLTRIGSEPPIAFAGYALLFAIFSISTLAALRCDQRHDSSLFFYFFLFALMAANPIHNIGGFRFNTASWVFLLGSYLVFFRGRNIGFVLILLAVAFHYAMSILFVLTVVLRFVRIPLRFAIILALASFAVSAGSQLFTPLLNAEYQIGALSRGARYVNDGALAARADALAQATHSNLFFFFFANTGIKFALGLWMAYLLIIKKQLRNIGHHERTFLIFGLILFGISNSLSEIPSFSRYNVIAIQILYMNFIVCGALYSRWEKKILLIIFVPAILFSLLITLRTGLGLVDMYSMFPSPFLIFDREPLLL